MVLGFYRRKKIADKATIGVFMDSSAVTVACVERDLSGPIRLRFALRQILNAPEQGSLILDQLVGQQRLQHSQAVVVLPIDSYQLIQVEMADLPPGERRDAARWLIRERIDYPPDKAVVDLFDVAPFGSEKKPLTYVVSAQQKILREQLGAIEQGGVTVRAMDIPEFALRNICELFVEDERGLAVLLLLEQRGVLVIVRDGTLYLVRLLNTGMNDLIPYAEGDDEALAEQLDSIVLEVQRSFDYCESTFHLPMVSRLLVAQTQQEIPAITSYLNDYLATRVESFSFPPSLLIPEGIEQLELNRQLLAIGGALRQEKH